ncbi:hypothetical protein BDY17DRAFT_313570 [Neohortaea acidophila]|uniref:SWI5-dependent HO expression protein 3 n=1 Tax=Neohortaea acidophila TaxID=245834 RepID=A0A6A6PGV3_9PEZI|nr:uncharacterized protein BDY17DRAFT_313570 [Neohortaea acidophila]KAF2478961.1 hypothetical protein BDY17DRAFT_313570 [Neohortaea acidophila]
MQTTGINTDGGESRPSYHLQHALGVDESILKAAASEGPSPSPTQATRPHTAPSAAPSSPEGQEISLEVRQLRLENENLRSQNAALNTKAIHSLTLAVETLHDNAQMIGHRASAEWELVREQQENRARITHLEQQIRAQAEHIGQLDRRKANAQAYMTEMDERDGRHIDEKSALHKKITELNATIYQMGRQNSASEKKISAEETTQDSTYPQEVRDLAAHIETLVAEKQEAEEWAGFGSPEWELLRGKDKGNAAVVRQIRVLIAEQGGQDVAGLEVEKLGDAETEISRLFGQVSLLSNATVAGYYHR